MADATNARFDIGAIAASFLERAETLLLDLRLANALRQRALFGWLETERDPR